MAAKKKSKRGKVPALIRHSSGQARVTLSGKTYYCGRWGSVAIERDLLRAHRTTPVSSGRSWPPAPRLREQTRTRRKSADGT